MGVTRQRLGYVQIKLSDGGFMPGEGKASDPDHDPGSYWIPFYNLSYEIAADTPNAQTGRSERLGHSTFEFDHEAFHNATGRMLESCSSKIGIDWAVIHVMGKTQDKGEKLARFRFVIEDGVIGAVTQRNDITSKGLHQVFNVKLTGTKVGFLQVPRFDTDAKVQAGYDFNLPGPWDPSGTKAAGAQELTGQK